MKKVHDISSHHTPKLLEESNSETVWAWCFVSIHKVKCLKNFLLREISFLVWPDPPFDAKYRGLGILISVKLDKTFWNCFLVLNDCIPIFDAANKDISPN